MGRKPKKRDCPADDSDDDRKTVGVAVESLDADDPTFRDEIADFHLQRGKLMLDEADEVAADDVLEKEFGGAIDPADLESSDADEDDSDGDDDSDEEAEGDSSKAWGKRSSTYYGTDYVDYGLGGDDPDEEAAALAEEEEAKAYQAKQQRLLSSADHEWGDMGDDDGEEELKSEGENETAVNRKSGWSDEEWMNHLEKTHAEVATLKELIAAKLKQVDDVEVLLKRGRALPPTPNTKQVLVFLGYKYQVLLMAVQHAAFYVHIIFKEIPAARHHPVVKAIFRDHGLIEHLEKCGRDGGVSYLVDALENGTGVEEAAVEGIRAMRAAGLTPGVYKAKRKRKKKKSKTARALDAKRRAAQALASGDGLDVDMDGEEGDEPARKRAITYEMAKNKGLTPHRKKEVRNPRVKMRKKFRKAVIRRKGQVRQIQRQEGSYGGEATGIRRDVVKTVKFKH